MKKSSALLKIPDAVLSVLPSDMKSKILSLFLLPLIITACSHKNATENPDTSVAIGFGRQIPVSSGDGKPTTLPMKEKVRVMDVPKSQSAMLPNATAFRMNGDFQDNVAVTFNAEGVLTYFPAPSDITADSRPVDLGNGWWLNNQGLSRNSVFTRYTFAEYAELPSAPDPDQLKNMVIPGSGVTQMIELPFKIGDANSHIPEIKEYLQDK